MQLSGLARELLQQAEQRDRFILGIAGCPGAGKSTLAEELLARIRAARGHGFAAHIPMDGFHLGDAQLDRLGLRGRKGAPETFDVAGYAVALERVRSGESDVYVPDFDRDLEQPVAAALIVPAEARLVITEGNYLLVNSPGWQRVRATLDAVWFVSLDDELRRRRLIQRHTSFGKSPAQAEQWVAISDDPNAALVAATSGSADRIIVS